MPQGPAVAVLIAVTTGFACEGAPEADLLLMNGRVYTLAWPDPALDGTPAPAAPHDSAGWHPDARAVAMSQGRIIFIGSDEDAEQFRAPHTWVRDLNGATVLPGLIDSHTHVDGLGANLSQVDLVGVETVEDVLRRLRAARPDPEPGEWIVGYGWDEGAWADRYPSHEPLSDLFPRNPVVLRSLHGFAVWGNQRALDEADLDARTPAPEGGQILRHAAGDPSGVLLNRATSLLTDAIPAPDELQRMAEYHAGLVEIARAGYVAVHEAGVDAPGMRALEGLERDGQLPIRVYAMLSARDTQLLRDWLARGPDRDDESRLRTRAVKAFYDGALGSRGARLLADYADRPGHRGVSGDAYGFDQNLVTQMMAAGFQAAIHAIGDAGNRETLDYFERVFAEHPSARANRHRIEHAQVVHPEDMARFGTLELIASMQPPHAVEDKPWAEDRLGPERIRGAYAWRSLRQHGARLVFNSDLTGSDHDIFYGLHAAVTRQDRQGLPPEGWYASEAATPEEAVLAYTKWAAYASFLEHETGLLAPGRRADLTVMDVDPFVLGTRSPEDLLDGHILLTIVGGEVVYDRIE